MSSSKDSGGLLLMESKSQCQWGWPTINRNSDNPIIMSSSSSSTGSKTNNSNCSTISGSKKYKALKFDTKCGFMLFPPTSVLCQFLNKKRRKLMEQSYGRNQVCKSDSFKYMSKNGGRREMNRNLPRVSERKLIPWDQLGHNKHEDEHEHELGDGSRWTDTNKIGVGVCETYSDPADVLLLTRARDNSSLPELQFNSQLHQTRLKEGGIFKVKDKKTEYFTPETKVQGTHFERSRFRSRLKSQITETHHLDYINYLSGQTTNTLVEPSYHQIYSNFKDCAGNNCSKNNNNNNHNSDSSRISNLVTSLNPISTPNPTFNCGCKACTSLISISHRPIHLSEEYHQHRCTCTCSQQLLLSCCPPPKLINDSKSSCPFQCSCPSEPGYIRNSYPKTVTFDDDAGDRDDKTRRDSQETQFYPHSESKSDSETLQLQPLSLPTSDRNIEFRNQGSHTTRNKRLECVDHHHQVTTTRSIDDPIINFNLNVHIDDSDEIAPDYFYPHHHDYRNENEPLSLREDSTKRRIKRLRKRRGKRIALEQEEQEPKKEVEEEEEGKNRGKDHTSHKNPTSSHPPTSAPFAILIPSSSSSSGYCPSPNPNSPKCPDPFQQSKPNQNLNQRAGKDQVGIRIKGCNYHYHPHHHSFCNSSAPSSFSSRYPEAQVPVVAPGPEVESDNYYPYYCPSYSPFFNNSCACDSTDLLLSSFSRPGFNLNLDLGMARKRYESAMHYETAFLPNSSSHTDAQNLSPDVDSILLAIETTSLIDSPTRLTNLNANANANTMRQHQSHRHGHGHQSPGRTDLSISISNILSPSSSSSPRLQQQQTHNQQSQPLKPGPGPSPRSPKSMSMMAMSVSKYVKKYLHSSATPSPSTSHPSSPYRQEVVVAEVSTRRQGDDNDEDENHEPQEPGKEGVDGKLKSKSNHDNSINSANLGLNITRNKNKNPLSLPLSEPLPVRSIWTANNANNSRQASSSSTMSMSISGSSASPQHESGSEDPHHHGKRNSLNLTKDNSISSLESLADSTKSEDFHHHHKFRLGNHNHGRLQDKNKLLSPISDKSPLSPLEPSKSMTIVPDQDDVDGRREGYFNNGHSHCWGDDQSMSARDILRAAELTNVPWEMPRLRRKLAVMAADSGISLDDLPPVAPSITRDFSNHSFFHNTISSGPSSREKKEESEQEQTQQGQYEKRGNLDLKLQLLDKENSDIGGGGGGPEEFVHGDYEEMRGNYLPPSNSSKPDRCKVSLDFSTVGNRSRNGIPAPVINFDPNLELECQDWFHGLLTRSEAEDILRPTREGSFLVRNCESTTFNQYSLSLKCARGFIHIRIELNSLGTFSLGDHEFPSVPLLIVFFMKSNLPIRGAETMRLKYPVMNNYL